MSGNSYLDFIIEWQFSAALLSLMLLASFKLIRNPFLASSFLKASFTIMLVLPLVCLLLKNSGLYLFAIFEASAPEAHAQISVVAGSTVSSSTPAETTNHLNAANIALFLVLIYAAASFIKLIASYRRLRKFCLQQQYYRTFNSIPVYTSQSSSFPFCFGLFRPLIVIPEALTANESDLEAALNHEKAHIDNGDHVYCIAQHLVKVVYIINPVVWYLNRRFCENQEILADCMASEAVGDKERYAHSLLNIVKGCQWPATPRLATGMAASKKQLMKRLSIILKQNKNMMKTIPRWKTNCVVLGLASLVSISLTAKLAAEEKPDKKDNQADSGEAIVMEVSEVIVMEALEGDVPIELAMQKVKGAVAEKLAEAGVPANAHAAAVMDKLNAEDLKKMIEEAKVITKTLQLDEKGDIVEVEGKGGDVVVRKHKANIRIFVNGEEVAIDDEDSKPE